MRKVLLWTLLIFALLMGTARAGDNSINITAEGKGIAVYQNSSGLKQIGTLYNGYFVSLSLADTNGLYSCYLTNDVTVWLDEDKALANAPQKDGYVDWETWHSVLDNMPCDMFIAEVMQDEAPLYTSLSHKTLTAKHKKGTLLQICGEFGDDYFVDMGNYYGFIPKAAVQWYAELTMGERYDWTESMAVAECTVYTGGMPLALGFSATGYCAERPIMVKDGEKVKVVRYLDGWAQLSNNAFIESRFLQPDGDHTIRYATVSSSKVLNRLNVRWDADEESSVEVKLFSGVRVQVPSHTEEWAAVCLTGTGNSEMNSGSAMMAYLVFDDTPVKDGCVKVRLNKTLYSGNGGAQYSSKWTGTPLPAGTEMTVIGVSGDYDIEWDSGDWFLCRMENGRVITVWNSDGVLEAVEGTGITVRTNTSVRFREKPNKEAKALRTLSSGTKVEVLLRGEGWTMVQYKDQVGYVMSRYLNFP